MKTTPELLRDRFERARRHWRRPPEETLGLLPARKKFLFTVAISRECGAGGESIARAVGSHLDWPVYDRELLEKIADQIGLRTELLESIDEKQAPWLTEWLESLIGGKGIGSVEFARRLAETILSLAVHGHCVIVGRGAAVILPEAMTLRVRLVAPLKTRITREQEKLGITERAAAVRVAEIDTQRSEFVRSHFRKDVNDIHEYDVTLNTERFSIVQCVDVIVAALRHLESASSIF